METNYEMGRQKSTCEGVNRYYGYSVESQWDRNMTARFSKVRLV